MGTNSTSNNEKVTGTSISIIDESIEVNTDKDSITEGDGIKNKEIEVSKHSKLEDILLNEQLDNISVTINSEEESEGGANKSQKSVKDALNLFGCIIAEKVGVNKQNSTTSSTNKTKLLILIIVS